MHSPKNRTECNQHVASSANYSCDLMYIFGSSKPQECNNLAFVSLVQVFGSSGSLYGWAPLTARLFSGPLGCPVSVGGL